MDLKIAFVRSICCPFDYTPGAMRNYARNKYKGAYPPGSQGTRTHQLAMYVVFNMPVAMLCDMPTAYTAEPEYTKILTQLPTVWDETRVLNAVFGEYVAIARRKGETWYIAAMTNWSEREVKLNTDFLKNQNYEAVLVKDGVNANKLASEYKIQKFNFDTKSGLTLSLKQGGGTLLILSPAN